MAVNAVGRSNSQAVVGLAATTQSTSSIEGTLGTWIGLKSDTFFTTDAIVKWAIPRVYNREGGRVAILLQYSTV